MRIALTILASVGILLTAAPLWAILYDVLVPVGVSEVVQFSLVLSFYMAFCCQVVGAAFLFWHTVEQF